MAFKFAKASDVANLELLHEVLVDRCRPSVTRSSSSTASSSRFDTFRDRKQRSLLHVAAKARNLATIRCLLRIGLSPSIEDANGDTAVSLLLQSCIKRSERKHRKRIKTTKGIAYDMCCELLQPLLERDPTLLSIRTPDGRTPAEMLQVLWFEASENQRMRGDKLLMDVMSKARQSTSLSSLTASVPDGGASDDEFLNSYHYDDEEYAWEDYFSEFGNQYFKSHLDSIREEYETKQRSFADPPRSFPKPKRPSPTLEPNRMNFFQRHKVAMAARQVRKPVVDFQAFDSQWKEFSSQTGPIDTLDAIPWPPFCGKHLSCDRSSSAALRIELVLRFVDNSTQSLRQLQVRWHPDRFFSKFGSRISPNIMSKVSSNVVAVSQLLNAATEFLRQNQGPDEPSSDK
ncbi:unnamed protein product [Dicrocoelium dendriticum]|nr:unnamed protein product [Dicrocoelium dendriticum]